MGIRLFIQCWKAMMAFDKLSAESRRIVFYSEGAGSWPHLGPLVEEIALKRGKEITYLSSDPCDPGLCLTGAPINALMIGAGSIRSALFRRMKAGVMMMTMPDLETYYVKCSPLTSHYIYVQHSMVSTHMIYRPGAFDHFDTILCAGPHHIEEIRRTEALGGLAPKNLVKHGYGRLDAIITKMAGCPPLPREGTTREVLIAPSWGPEGLLESDASPLVYALLAAGHRVTVRPHPLSFKHGKRQLSSLRRTFAHDPSFNWDVNITGTESLLRSHIMISDWSGAALEYAFGIERPVLFIDLPRKVNNPEFAALGIEPLEVTLRNEIGAITAPSDVTGAVAAVTNLTADPQAYRERIGSIRDAHVFNISCSARIGADTVMALADEHEAKS